MKSVRVVKLIHEIEADFPDQAADAFDRNGADLFCLRLGVGVQSGLFRRLRNLERIDAVGVGGDRHDRDHPATQACCRGVGVHTYTRHMAEPTANTLASYVPWLREADEGALLSYPSKF